MTKSESILTSAEIQAMILKLLGSNPKGLSINTLHELLKRTFHIDFEIETVNDELDDIVEEGRVHRLYEPCKSRIALASGEVWETDDYHTIVILTINYKPASIHVIPKIKKINRNQPQNVHVSIRRTATKAEIGVLVKELLKKNSKGLTADDILLELEYLSVDHETLDAVLTNLEKGYEVRKKLQLIEKTEKQQIIQKNKTYTRLARYRPGGLIYETPLASRPRFTTHVCRYNEYVYYLWK